MASCRSSASINRTPEESLMGDRGVEQDRGAEGDGGDGEAEEDKEILLHNDRINTPLELSLQRSNSYSNWN